MAAQPEWPDGYGQGDEMAPRRAALRRADEAYEQRVDAQRAINARRIDLMAEFAAIADEMTGLARRTELSAQQIATARRLTARAERALRLLEAERG